MNQQIQGQDSTEDESLSRIECKNGERFRPLPEPETVIGITDWREAISSSFPDCLKAAEIGASVIAQLMIKDIHNPFGLVYVGVPSSGKTTTLNFFSSMDNLIYKTDYFTPAAVVSHASNRSKKDLKEIDLLPKMRYKAMLVADFAPIFADREEVLKRNLGMLTRLFDGKGYESDSGVHGKRGYRGDYLFMFLACSTPVAPRIWKHMGSLGSRLFFLNVHSSDRNDEELSRILVDQDYEDKEEFCRYMTKNLIYGLWKKCEGGLEWDKSKDPEPVRQAISRYARLIACLRGNTGNPNDLESPAEPVIEKPLRIVQMLYNLARGHALISGRTNLTMEDLWPCRDIALSSAPWQRIRSLMTLIENKGVLKASDIQSSLGRSNPTALKEMRILSLLGIVNITRVKEGKAAGASIVTAKIRDEFSWLLDEDLHFLKS